MLKVAQMKVIYEMIGADRSIRGMAEVWVMAWKKGERHGVVVRGAGGPGASSNVGGGTVRIVGRVPWGAGVEYAYRAGYDSRGRVSVNHIVDESGLFCPIGETAHD